jgi:hypothetical protein
MEDVMAKERLSIEGTLLGSRKRARDNLSKDRSEVPDPVPMAPPVGYVKQESLTEKIRAMVRGEHLRLAAINAGAETFEESDDFDVGDDVDPSSPYEEVFDPVDSDARMALRNEEFRAKFEARMAELKGTPPAAPTGAPALDVNAVPPPVVDDKK